MDTGTILLVIVFALMTLFALSVFLTSRKMRKFSNDEFIGEDE